MLAEGPRRTSPEQPRNLGLTGKDLLKIFAAGGALVSTVLLANGNADGIYALGVSGLSGLFSLLAPRDL